LQILSGAVKNLSAKASRQDLSLSHLIEAKRFLEQLQEGIRLLYSPNGVNYLNDVYAARGSSVAEVVEHMRTNGLSVAPAAGGDEDAYVGLYNALITYLNSLESQAAGRN
jgi:hypothetical protein